MQAIQAIGGNEIIIRSGAGLRLRGVTRLEAREFFVHHPHLRGLWDRHARLGGLGRCYLRQRSDASIERWGHDPKLTGSVYILEKFCAATGAYRSVGVSGWWGDPTCWPDTVKFRWQAIARSGGRGLGRDLVTLSAQAIRLECRRARFVSESCPAWSRGLIRFYQRLGFEFWNDQDRRGVGIPLVSTVSLRLSLDDLPVQGWGFEEGEVVPDPNHRRPMGSLKFVFLPDPRYGI